MLTVEFHLFLTVMLHKNTIFSIFISHIFLHRPIKSDNLQYNALVCWFPGNQVSDVLSIIFFIITCKIFCKILFQKSFQFIYFFQFFYKFKKMKIKSFECANSIRNYKKDNAWNIRPLVDKSFVAGNQQASVYVSYCRLSDFRNKKIIVIPHFRAKAIY